MIKKITFVALIMALAAATYVVQPPPAPVCPSTACYFSKTNLIVNGGFENPQVSSWNLFNSIQGWAFENDQI
jgi:hypothetical protein